MGQFDDSQFCMELFTGVFTMFKLLNDEKVVIWIYIVILICLCIKIIQVVLLSCHNSSYCCNVFAVFGLL